MSALCRAAGLALAAFMLCLPAAVASAAPAPDEAAALTACPGADAVGGAPARRREAMSCLLDAVRNAAGERGLVADRRLRRSAAAKARDVARCGRFEHAPCGEAWHAGIRRAGYAGASVAESLAWVAPGTPRQVLQLWLRSPDHRANLLNPAYRDTGLARRTARLPGPGVVEVWVQHLGTPG